MKTILSTLLAIVCGFASANAQGINRSQYELLTDVKSADLHVAGLNRYVIRTLNNTKADSLTIVAKLSDSVTTSFRLLSIAPDGAPLDSTAVLSSLTSTNAVKYTSATVAIGARHQASAIVLSAKSNRSTTANSTADGVRVWIYLHNNK